MKKEMKVPIIILGILLGLLMFSIFMHNALSALLGIEDQVFWFLFVVLIFVFPLAVIYTSVLLITFLVNKYIKKK